jgi:hypothetical protein
MAKIAVVTYGPHGEVEVDLNGFQGQGCHAIQEALSKDLGGDVQKEVKKAEFNKPLTKTTCVTR